MCSSKTVVVVVTICNIRDYFNWQFTKYSIMKALGKFQCIYTPRYRAFPPTVFFFLYDIFQIIIYQHFNRIKKIFFSFILLPVFIITIFGNDANNKFTKKQKIKTKFIKLYLVYGKNYFFI